MRRLGIATLFVLTATLLTPRAAAAQGPGDTNVFAGYSFLHVNDTDDLLSNFPAGFEFGINHRLTGTMPNLSIGAKFQFNGTSVVNFFPELPGTNANFGITESLFGVMFGPPPDAAKRVWVFGSLFLGNTHTSVEAGGESDSVNGFTLQPGGGLGVFLTPNLGLQFTGEVPVTWNDGDTGTGFRFGVSASFRLR